MLNLTLNKLNYIYTYYVFINRNMLDKNIINEHGCVNLEPLYAIKNNDLYANYTEDYEYNDASIWIRDTYYRPEIYLSSSPVHLLWVLHNPTRYYNTDYNKPSHDFKDIENFKIVDFLTDKEVKNIKLPTREDIYIHKAHFDKGYKRILEDYLKDCEIKKIAPKTDYRTDYWDF